MSDIVNLNGYILYNSFISGYENLLRHKKFINDINVFPVADGDTGTNMVSTFYSTIQVPSLSRSVSRTLNHIADRALSGARGNSGIIVAQYLNGLADACAERDTMTTREFGAALRKAAATTCRAVENPKEGTLITIMNVWSEEMYRLGHAVRDFRDLFIQSIGAARSALERTTLQLAVLKTANVVDAGASGFVSFLEGVARMIVSGTVPPKRRLIPLSIGGEDSLAGEAHEALADIPYRYCTEALLLRPEAPVRDLTPQQTPTRDGVPAAGGSLRELLKGLGDSLIVSEGRDKIKIHIHTDEPSRVFFLLRGHGRIIEQKVDDMRLQYQAVHHPVSRTAILTDSIADIPGELIDRFQIHVIPQKILWGDDEYLDRLTITPETLYPYLDGRSDYPGSSVPDPRRVDQVMAWLAAHYESVIAIPVGKALSGTWQVMEQSAKKLREAGYPVFVVDSRLNSAAQGLAVLSASGDAANGLPCGEILERLGRTIARSRILVSVATFKYMVRGGRISALKGFIAALTNLKPVITLDPSGKGVAFGAAFSQRGSLKKILKAVRKNRGAITRYAVVHAGVPERAAAWAKDISAILGFGPEYIMEISPAVGLHAGLGSVAVAYVLQ